MRLNELDRTSPSVFRDDEIQSRAHLRSAQAPEIPYWETPLLQGLLLGGLLLLHLT